MKPLDLVLRCYAQKDKDGSWFAICIDVNLCVRADSSNDAMAQLKNIIHAYIEEACTEDVKYFNDLIPRKAPLGFVFKYHLISLLHKIHIATDARKFNEHLPMIPA